MTKPFTDWKVGETYRLENGFEVRIYATDGWGRWPIHGAYKDPSGGWHACQYDKTGQERHGSIGYNLVPPATGKKTLTFGVNVYPGVVGSCHKTRGTANCYADSGRIACLEITRAYVEGEGL